MNVHPLIQEIIDERAEIDARDAALRATSEATWAGYEERLTAWREDAKVALDEGRDPGPEPSPPDLSAVDDERRRLRWRRERLAEREARVLVEILPDLEAEAAVEMAEVLAEAGPHVEALVGLATWATEILRPVRQARGAADNARGRRLASRTDARSHPVPVTLRDLVAARSGTVDLLAVAPPPARADTEPHVDRGQPEPVVLGLQRKGGWGTPPTDPPRRPRTSRDWT